MRTLRVLVVEDDPIAAQAHTSYVRRVAGFEVAGTVQTSADALRALQREDVDLVLLDMNLPDRHGLEVVRAMRAAGHTADVIAVTSARELEVVRSAVSLGVVQYVLKPFVFAGLRDRLTAYLEYAAATAGELDTQADVDRMLGALRHEPAEDLPKGLSRELLDRVTTILRGAESGMTAAELGVALSVSRVTARRYAEHLAGRKLATRATRPTRAGRPEVEYRWRA
ncbi:response regulator [Flexivirga meconopsidis]|uniref:response regulator n=1 Tax=Flexivirga meconopsidis TaxID=2977121 RepID=UPI00223FF6DF|nr:response regulator [Flexivirga meconopsidis]